MIRSHPSNRLRGKVGGLVYSLQPNGTTTVREAGQESGPSTEGEKKGQRRMKLAHVCLHWARVEGSTAKVWVYTARNDLPAGQTISLEVTATDRCGHSTVKTLVQPI